MKTPDLPLRDVTERTKAIATEWAPLLTSEDRVALLEAFEIAETFALFALECAMEQVGERYRHELLEQIADERRHISTFSKWRGLPLREMNRVRRTRDDYVWFTLLLINELTGYCQFQMLSILVETESQRYDVQRICEDEEKHIARLVHWLAPAANSTRSVVPKEMVRRFERELPLRMLQFMPRAELAPLRDAMVTQVGLLMRWVLEQVLTSEPGAQS